MKSISNVIREKDNGKLKWNKIKGFMFTKINQPLKILKV